MLVSALGIYAALLLCTRLSGLRSFSKMSSFDFAITVAFGSIVASTLLAESPALVTGVGGLVVLFLIQAITAFARRRSYRIERLVGNEPLLLMAGPDLLPANLDAARVTVDDIRAKLRLGLLRFHTSAALASANRVLQGASRRIVASHDQDSQRRRARFAAQPFGASAVFRQSSVLALLRRMTARQALRLVLPQNSAWRGLA